MELSGLAGGQFEQFGKRFGKGESQPCDASDGGSGETCVGEIGVDEIGVDESSVGQICIAKTGTAKIRAAEVGSG